MKNIIIAGPARVGKTTLARVINEELGHFVISIDKLVAMFSGAYPELDIRLNWNRKKTKDNIAPFLGQLLGAFSTGQGTAYELNLGKHDIKGNKFVLEGAYFNFDKIMLSLKKYGIENLQDNFITIGLVQNKKSVEEYINDFRKYDTEEDWTYGFSDDELREYVVEDAIPLSCSMTEHLLKHGFTIYDTSEDRECVFHRIVEELKLRIKV